jgi:ComF family protein
LKYKNQRSYAKIYAAELAKHFEKQIRMWGVQEIIPVPLHKKRYKKRGYNQAELIARELSKQLSIPLDTKTVFRVKHTRPQKELNDVQRNQNLEDAFFVSPSAPKRKCVLIVDDIYTTGSTIHHIAQGLKKAGVDKVYFLTISIGQGL